MHTQCINTIGAPCRAGVLLLAKQCRMPLGPRPRALLHGSRAASAAAAATPQPQALRPCSSALWRSSLTSSRHFSTAAVSRQRCSRLAALPPLAMINVDFASPSLVLGITLIGCGIALLQVRNVQREVSRDADIVVAAMISIVGSTLIFQGWRLDPLLLLCQALTTSVAFWYGLETFKLRGQIVEEEDEAAGRLPPPEGLSEPRQAADPYTQARRGGFLSPAADRQAQPWGTQQQQQQPGLDAGARRYGLPPGAEEQLYGSYVGQQQQQQQPMQQPEDAFAGYGDPLLQQQQRLQQQQQQQLYGSLPPGMMADAGFGSSTIDGGGYSGMYAGQQQFGQQLPQQQQPFGVPGDYQGIGWYAGDAAAGYDQPPFGSAAGGYPGDGAAGMTADAAAVAAAGIGQYRLPAGAAAGYPPLEGSALLPLPTAAGEQQQQQQQQQPQRGGQQQQQVSGGRPAYERVDDWE